MIKTPTDENAEFYVACADDFPRCMNGVHNYSVGLAVKESECRCHLAREAAYGIGPRVMLRNDAADS